METRKITKTDRAILQGLKPGMHRLNPTISIPKTFKQWVNNMQGERVMTEETRTFTATHLLIGTATKKYSVIYASGKEEVFAKLPMESQKLIINQLTK